MPDPAPGPDGWRPMDACDIPAVADLAARIHPDFPEDAAVFAERQRLYPAGCFLLVREGAPAGYAISHPWRPLDPPKLDSMLGRLPDGPGTYYIHDIAVLPDMRGSGTASEILRRLLAHAAAAGLPSASLVAVNRSGGFWSRHGFREASDPAMAAKLRSYDADARFMVMEPLARRFAP